MWLYDPTKYRDFRDYLERVDGFHLRRVLQSLPHKKRMAIIDACQLSTEENRERRRTVNRLSALAAGAALRALPYEQRLARIRPAMEAQARMTPEQKKAKAQRMVEAKNKRLREEHILALKEMYGDILSIRVPDTVGRRAGLDPEELHLRKKRAIALYVQEPDVTVTEIAKRVGLNERTMYRMIYAVLGRDYRRKHAAQE